MPEELIAIQTAFHFTTSGGGLLIQRIAEIETLALSNIQSGKSLDRVVTGALSSLRDACNTARVAVA
jgi:hypothetical protein